MTDQHPITPPDELVQRWLQKRPEDEYAATYLATQAARWGADQELEACCALMDDWGLDAADLRAARRPKQPSLKELALSVLENEIGLNAEDVALLRRALELVPEGPAVTPPAAAPDRPLWWQMWQAYLKNYHDKISNGYAAELRVVADWLGQRHLQSATVFADLLRAEAERAEAP